MVEYPPGSPEDRTTLAKLSSEKLLDYLFFQVRNTWRVDGLYFLEIEKRFGTEAAAQIDANVWSGMGAIEAKALRRKFGVDENPDVRTIIDVLSRTSWALDQPFKTIEADDNHATLSIDRCRTQEARLDKSLGEFPCKQVRLGYLNEFARALNPDVEVNCMFCPPDKHPGDSWCKWEFKSRQAEP